ncbi:major facilitator family transporter [Neisseria meningitidis]|nr:major facilitator family transporter [Neisseria meningitidis]
MGAQSTLFGPLKYAILPDYLDDKELMMGNSLIESGTFVAILFGQILGTAVAGVPPYIVGILVLLVAVGGTVGSLFMPSVPAKAADTQIEWNIVRGTKSLLRETVRHKPVFTAIIGISWFWFVGAVYTTQLPTFTQIHLGGNDNVFNLMLALFSIGIAAGSVLCAKFSRERLRLAWVTVGALGLTVCGLVLVWLTHGHRFEGLNGIFWFLSQGWAYPVMAVMTLIGFFGGFFSVPLYTWLQTASSETFRARAVAANNIVNGIFMVSAAVLSAVLLFLFDSISLLYLIVALGNIPLSVFLIKRERRFLGAAAIRKKP